MCFLKEVQVGVVGVVGVPGGVGTWRSSRDGARSTSIGELRSFVGDMERFNGVLLRSSERQHMGSVCSDRWQHISVCSVRRQHSGDDCSVRGQHNGSVCSVRQHRGWVCSVRLQKDVGVRSVRPQHMGSVRSVRLQHKDSLCSWGSQEQRLWKFSGVNGIGRGSEGSCSIWGSAVKGGMRMSG